MPTINQLPVLSVISTGDQLPVYSPNNGDARRTSIGSLLTFFQQSFASSTLSVNLFVPGSGFNITVPTPVSNDQWMLLQPAGTLATGTITLPLNTGVPDGTTVLITSTQQITSLTIALNGATAIYGGVTFLSAGSATAIRFYQPTNSWYQINANEVYGSNIQAFLAVPSSANLRAAMTDETGTGLLVFNTTPTLTTPIITNPTVSTGTFTSPTFVTPALGTVASGNISACTSTSMVMVTPVIGAATGTSLVLSSGAVIQGLTVGLGAGSVSTNTAVGTTALNSNITGALNVAVGFESLLTGTAVSTSVGVGYRTLRLSTGDRNVAVGGFSMDGTVGASDCVAVGRNTLRSLVNNGSCTAIGTNALTLATGQNNTALGYGAGENITTGAGNIAFSGYTSTGTNAPVFNITTENNRISMGSTSVTNAYIQVAFTVVSDARDKTDFAPVPHGLDFVCKLQPTAYRYKETRDATKGHGPLRYGFKAQDVLALEGDASVIVDAEDLNKLRFNDQALIAVLVNAIKELKAEFDNYKASQA